MSFKRLIFFFTFLAIFTMAFRISIDSDTWWHLRAGAEIVERREILTEDPFSLTRYQEPWRYPGWLAQLILYGFYQVLGYAGLNIITALMVTVAFLWVWKFIEGPLLLRSTLVLFAAITSGVYWSARPQIFTFALSGVFIHLLERERSGRPVSLWIFPVIMALWGNMHGGFAIGFILLMAYAGGDLLAILTGAYGKSGWLGEAATRATPILRKYGVIFVLCLIGISLNPHGPSMVLYPFRTVSIGALQEYIQEWQSPDFHELQVQPFLLMIVVAFVSFGLRKRRGHPTDYLLVLGFMAMSLWAARNIATFALAGVIPISRALASIAFGLKRQRSDKPLDQRVQKYLNSVIAVFILLAAGVKISIPLSNELNQQAVAQAYPSRAVGYIRSTVKPVPIFNSYNWGAYVIWELYPDFRSFVDGRTDLFNDEILEQYLSAWRGEPEWMDIFEDWGIELALVEPSSPLATRLLMAGWERAYDDEQAVVLVKPEHN